MGEPLTTRLAGMLKGEDTSALAGSHSRPSKLDNTGPRKYKSLCGGGWPSNLMRMATLSSSARLARVPTCIFALKPLRPTTASLGTPHKGANRGNSKKSTIMMGAPSKAIQPAVLAACSKGGLPTGMWALTSTVSKPSKPSNILTAVSSDCE